MPDHIPINAEVAESLYQEIISGIEEPSGIFIGPYFIVPGRIFLVQDNGVQSELTGEDAIYAFRWVRKIYGTP